MNEEFEKEIKDLITIHLPDKEHYDIELNHDRIQYGHIPNTAKFIISNKVEGKYGSIVIKLHSILRASTEFGTRMEFRSTLLNKYNINDFDIYDKLRFISLHEARHVQQFDYMIKNIFDEKLYELCAFTDIFPINDIDSFFQRDADTYAIHFLKDKNLELLDIKENIKKLIKDNKRKIVNEYKYLDEVPKLKAMVKGYRNYKGRFEWVKKIFGTT